MKKTVLTLLFLGVASLAIADIQAPIGDRYGAIRKLTRGIANIFYGIHEVPANWSRTVQTDGGVAAASTGLGKGVEKTIVRLGYGVYEVVTFPFPIHKGGYKDPYYLKRDINPYAGYEEYPPQMGFISEAEYVRNQVP